MREDVLELFAEAQELGPKREFLDLAFFKRFRNLGLRQRRPEGQTVAEYHRAWREKNPERARAISRDYRQRALAKDAEAFRERRRAANRRHYARNREAMLERAKLYAQANAEKRAAAKRARRTARRGEP